VANCHTRLRFLAAREIAHLLARSGLLPQRLRAHLATTDESIRIH